MSISDLTKKLPLINSSNIMVKLLGYFIYFLVFMIVIGALLPSQDTTTSSAEQTSTKTSTGAEQPLYKAGFGAYKLDNQEMVTIDIRKSNDPVHLMSLGELPTDSWFTKDGSSYTITSTEGGQLKGYIDYTDDGYVVVLRPISSDLTKGEFKKIVESFRRVEK